MNRKLRGTKIISKIKMVLVIIIFAGCQSTKWQNFPPTEFQGRFVQVSNEVIQGYEKPITIEITEKKFQYESPENDNRKTYPILKVSKTGDRIVIFCGEKNENNIADYRYEMFWGSDNYLYINTIIATGYNNEDGKFGVGKFTENEYLNPK